MFTANTMVDSKEDVFIFYIQIICNMKAHFKCFNCKFQMCVDQNPFESGLDFFVKMKKVNHISNLY